MKSIDPSLNQQAEAFCLMTYRCESCENVEYVWNSRDGVTPFYIACSECKTGSRCIDAGLGMPRYFDIPVSCSRVFVSMTKKEAMQKAQKDYSKHGRRLRESFRHLKESEIVQRLYEGIYDNGNACQVLTREEYMKRDDQS